MKVLNLTTLMKKTLLNNLIFLSCGLFASEDVLDHEISSVFREIRRPKEQAPDSHYALVAAVATLGSMVTADRTLNHVQTRNPAALLALSPEALRLGITAGVSLVTTYLGFKAINFLRQSFESPYERQVKELRNNQKEFEEHLEEQLGLRLQQVEEKLTKIIKKERGAEKEARAYAVEQLEQQHRILTNVREKISPESRKELDQALEHNANSIKKLKALDAITKEISEEYSKKSKNPVKNFFHKMARGFH